MHGSTPNNNPRALALMVVYGVKGYLPDVPSSVFDQVYLVDNGRVVMQTDLDLHGYRLVNNNQGGLSFDSGGVISLHDNLNTNGYSRVGKNGGGFEVDDNVRTKMHENIDLNGHGIHETLDFLSGNIRILKDINMNNKKIINLGDAANDNDAITKRQAKDIVTASKLRYLHGKISIGEREFSLSGSTGGVITNDTNITRIDIYYKKHHSIPSVSYPNVGLHIYDFYSTPRKGSVITNRINLGQQQEYHLYPIPITFGISKIELSSGPIDDERKSTNEILILVTYQ